MQSARISRRSMLGLLGGAASVPMIGPLVGNNFITQALAQDSDTLTIAFNVDLPTFDPTVGPSAVNPTWRPIDRL